MTSWRQKWIPPWIKAVARRVAGSSDDNFVLIQERDVGLFSLFLQVVNTLQLTEQTGAIPIVLFADQCAYHLPGGYREKQTVWEYYFEPIDEGYPEGFILDFVSMSDNETKRFHRKAIVTSEYYPRFAPLPDEDRIPFLEEVNNHHRRLGAHIISRHIRPRAYISTMVNAFFQEHLADQFVIGLHLRGTDAVGSLLREREIDVADYIAKAEACIEEQRKQGVSKVRIYAASDDQKYIDLLKDHFGDMLASYDALRKTTGRDKGRGPTGELMPHYIAQEPRLAAKNGEEVVVEYLLLCRSDYFVHNISSVSRAVLVTNPGLRSHNVQNYSRAEPDAPHE